jgi:ubiquinone/menaquinone biosynthesis C-methylase UbiE
MNPDYKFAPAFISNFFTPFYDLVLEQGGLGKTLQDKIVNIAKLNGDEKVLDVGCGSGGLLVRLKTRYSNLQLVGVDPDKKILDIAKRKIENKRLDIKLVNALAEKLPFEDKTFDIVVSSLTFHHLPTEIKKKTLGEIFRVLKPHGRFILADIGKPDSLFWKIKFTIDLERLLTTGEYMRDNLEGRLPTLVEETGFKVKEVTRRHQGIQFFEAIK